MRFGIHTGLWLARWTDDLTPALRAAADLGYDGVEVSLLGMTEARAEALGREIRAHGLAVTCSDGLATAKDITSPDPEIRAAGVAYLNWAVEIAARIGAQALAGVLYAPWGQFDPLGKPARATRAAEALGQLDATLAREGVTLGLEALNRFETDLVTTAAEAVALAETTGSPRIGVLLDTFHLNIEEKDIAGAIAGAGDRLAHFHVSDNDRGVPGSGHVPWDQVSDGLARAGYDGWIVAEMFVIAGNPASADLNIWRDIEPDATGAARQALTFLRERFA